MITTIETERAPSASVADGEADLIALIQQHIEKDEGVRKYGLRPSAAEVVRFALRFTWERLNAGDETVAPVLERKQPEERQPSIVEPAASREPVPEPSREEAAKERNRLRGGLDSATLIPGWQSADDGRPAEERAALEAVKSLGWAVWAGEIPPLQQPMHDFYAQRGWRRMWCVREIEEDAPDGTVKVARFRAEFYWYPQEKYSGEWDRDDPEFRAAMEERLPADARVALSERPADSDGTALQRAWLTYGVIDGRRQMVELQSG